MAAKQEDKGDAWPNWRELVDRLLERQHMGEVIHRDNASVIVHCSHGRERGVVYMANEVMVGQSGTNRCGLLLAKLR
ncbi:MAG: hypothetical protein KC481_08630 [Acidimicrobiaceae bacterium]|nr:hypothetical protein [Acidimicrobiaceae bacterium]